MKNKKIVNFVAHTHWDREWYFSINDAALLSTWNFERVVEVLEKNPNFPSFCLDGQTSIIEDAIELKPELKNKITKLVKEKRIFLGPWHTQTDSFYVDGESYIRNIYFGSMLAKEFGHSMKLGYLPDTFGHNIQTPQIFKGFNIDTILFWRGRNPKEIKDTYFKWVGLDGSKVLAMNILHGYSPTSGIKLDKKEWDNKTIPIIKNLKNDTKYNNLLLPSGGDQVLIDENLPNVVKGLDKYLGDDYEVKLTNYESFVQELKKEIGDLNNLEIWNDELRYPVKARVHRTIGSSRYDLKKKSFELEHKLVNILEPLSIIIKEKVDQKLINQELIKKAWKLLLDGHAHDSLGACNTDITNENVLNRFKRAENLIDGTINLFKKTIGINIKNKFNKDLVLYNFDTKNVNNEYREIVLFSSTKNIKVFDDKKEVFLVVKNIERIGAKGAREVILTPKGDIEKDIPPYYKITALVKVSIPSFGYKSFIVKEIKEEKIIESNNNIIENNDIKIELVDNKINILNKKINKIYNEFISLENVANDGDSYDFSPLKNDQPIQEWELTNLVSKKITDSISEIKFSTKVIIPFELIDRKKRSSKKVEQVFNFIIFINDSNIKVNIKTTNIAKDHRFRVKFNHMLKSKDKIFTDVPFGYYERKFIPIPDDWKKWMVEKPVNYYPIINTFYTKSDDDVVLINTKGIKEIEIKENKDIYLTLYKSDGWLGKNDLELRPNRASGINNVLVPTPDAQLFYKDLEFDFEVNFCKKDINEYEINKIKKLYITKFDYYQTQNLDIFKDRLERFQLHIDSYDLDQELSLYKVDNLTLVSSYISHKDNSNIFRFVNYKDEIIDNKNVMKKYQKEDINFGEEKTQHKEINKYKLVTYKIFNH